MANVRPFRGVLPARKWASQVASRPYHDYLEGEREAIMRINPYSFLHVLNPGFRIHKSIKGIERFQLVRQRYREFVSKRIFERDHQAVYYVYRVQQSGYTFTGFLGAAAVEDYNAGVIRRHEETLQNKEDLFAHYLKTVGFNSEPVLMTYRQRKPLNDILEKVSKMDPDIDILCAEGDTHSLWRITDPESIHHINEGFRSQSELYIADGHHRSASSAQYCDYEARRRPNMPEEDPCRYFMSYLISEDQIRIYGFSRYITDLGGLDRDTFLRVLEKDYRLRVMDGFPRIPIQPHRFVMYLDGVFYELSLREDSRHFHSQIEFKLDTVLLYDSVLKPILGIRDLRNDPRIAYSSGKQSLPDMRSAVDSGKYALAFAIPPLDISQLKKVADDNMVMPPKTTFIEPKMRNGLVIYELFSEQQ